MRSGTSRMRYFRHANYDPTAYFAHRAKNYPQPQAGLTYEPMSLTYQPLTLQENGLDQLGDIRYKTKWYPNGSYPQGMYLTVMHRPEDNGLDFNFEHQIKAVSQGGAGISVLLSVQDHVQGDREPGSDYR